MDLENKIGMALINSINAQGKVESNNLSSKIANICREYNSEFEAWCMNELDLLRQENEQLQVDLMIAEEMFDATPMTRNGVAISKINIKRRSNFKS